MTAFTVVRALDEGHIEQLVSLYQNEWWTRGRTVEDVRRMVAGSTHVFAVCASPGDQVFAFARVLSDGVYKALVLDVIVATPFRHHGLGRRLMDVIVNEPGLRHVRHVELYCLPELQTFYEQWGFSKEVSGVGLMRRTTS